jgi:hypothetical protein
MRFVLGDRSMRAVGGTVAHLVTLGEHLPKLGHQVIVYSPELGPFADYARRRGIDVRGELSELPRECDVVLAQDAMVVHDLADRYPDALMVFRVCGAHEFHTPPQAEGRVDLVLVLADRYARLAEACAIRAPLLRLRVPIDTDRLVPDGAIRARPRRAMVLGNYPDRVRAVGEAWERRGLKVAYVGGPRARFDVAQALHGVDIVVAKSRAALDAMACGRAVYVYDTFGGDGWVTPETYPAMEADHFAGQATDRVIGVRELERDLADYHIGMGTVNRDLVLQHHGARDHTIEFVIAVAAAVERKRGVTPASEPFGTSEEEHALLRRRLSVAEETVVALRVQLAEIRASRGLRAVERYRRVRDLVVRRGR